MCTCRFRTTAAPQRLSDRLAHDDWDGATVETAPVHVMPRPVGTRFGMRRPVSLRRSAVDVMKKWWPRSFRVPTFWLVPCFATLPSRSPTRLRCPPSDDHSSDLTAPCPDGGHVLLQARVHDSRRVHAVVRPTGWQTRCGHCLPHSRSSSGPRLSRSASGYQYTALRASGTR